MILYNITFNIEKNDHDEWMDWMKMHFIPLMLDSGLFNQYKILRLLNEDAGNPGITYSFQFYTKDLNMLKKFETDHQHKIDGKLYSKFKNRLVEFRTMLEVIE